MKKEIDVWIGYDGDTVKGGNFNIKGPYSEQLWRNSIKAKLIIEMPEPKIEVMESVVRGTMKRLLENHGDIEKAIKELFGEG